jgi:ribosome maturation factor RimP
MAENPKTRQLHIDDCVKLSHALSDVLDEADPIEEAYRLEVSSPGIERKLKTLHHFKCSIGSKVKIKNYQTETVKGTVVFVSDEGLVTFNDLDNKKQEIQYDDILSASTYFDWNN